jgi:hypothetical protein
MEQLAMELDFGDLSDPILDVKSGGAVHDSQPGAFSAEMAYPRVARSPLSGTDPATVAGNVDSHFQGRNPLPAGRSDAAM